MVAQSNPGGRPWMLIILVFFRSAGAEFAVTAVNVPSPASAKETPASTVKSPIKTRRLKKADREADLFFIG
jgi:hypothetical protein